MNTEILDAPTSQVAAYVPFYSELAKLEEDNTKLTFDYESKKGNAEARSHVYKLRQSKGALERTRKSEKSESLRIGKAIDSEAQALEARIEAMIKVHQDEIDKIEQREKDRITALQKRLSEITPGIVQFTSSDEVRKNIARVEAISIASGWEEFVEQAASTKEMVLARLAIELDSVIKREAEATELARLRAETVAREQADRDAAIVRAAEERVKAEAERKAQDTAVAQAKAIRDSEAKAAQEREAAARRELELRLAAEQAERRRVESEQRAEQDRKDAISRSEKQAADAVLAEKARVEAAARAKAAETAKREANRAHKAHINRAAMDALIAGGVPEDCAKQCITLIASGKVPSIAISY